MDRNDLISRSELKKAIKEFEDVRGYSILLYLIDNAPTVKTYCYFCGQTEHGQIEERPQGEIKKYKPLEPDYNVQCAVENLKTAYWSNDIEKYAKAFTEADQMIVSAICHYGYIVSKRPQGEWIPVSERWPSFSGLYLVSVDDLVTVAHFTGVCFINRRGLMIDVSAWQELPEPYKKDGADMRQTDEPDKQITIEEYMQSLKGEN